MSNSKSHTSEIREFFKGTTYLDPTYDPAFKEFFGEEEIRFRTPYPKNLTFDIFASSENGRF